jgi:hypothetical protein
MWFALVLACVPLALVVWVTEAPADLPTVKIGLVFLLLPMVFSVKAGLSQGMALLVSYACYTVVFWLLWERPWQRAH